MQFSKISVCAVLMASSAITPAMAEDAAFDEQDTILVVGQSDGYAATNSVTATKTDTPLVDIPQTINVITRDQLDDQALRSIGDVLRYVPGTTVQQGEGNRDQITIRGQESTSDFFLDGVRDDVQYFRNLYNIERVEILKGPYALIFGRGGGGGIINRVQKAPIANETGIGAEGSINSFGAWEVAGDVNAPLGDAGALRINGFYEELANHRDFYNGRRFAVNPYLGFDLGNDWKVGLSYEYVDDDRVTDRGIPSDATNRPARGLRDQFFGVPGINVTTLQAHIAKLRVDGKLSDNLSVSSTVLYGNYDKLYENVFANGPVSAANSVALAGYTDPTTRENIIAQANAVWDINTGSIAHKILFGLEYGHQDSTNQRRDAVLSNSVLNLNNIIFPTVTFPVVNRNRVSTVEFFSAYVQDQISLSDHFDIVAGIRYDNFDISGIDIAGGNRAFGRTDSKVSPRVGLIYKPQENVSFYASYSQSFQPRSGDQFLTLSAVQENLEPEKFTNYEVGAKWDIEPGLALTAAIFRLDRTNNTTGDPANPGNIILLPGTRAQGVELHIAGQVTDKWQVSGGYTFINAHVEDSNVRIDQQPQHQVALWNRYNLNDNFGGGVGVIHQSSQFASISNTVLLPAFTRVDAALFWDVNEKFGLQLNVENLFDTEYFSDAHNNNNISTGAPINARLSARIKF
ncbi:TonB-dependent receptor [Sphingorhabdus arenilitoris]|uniref:TonB-dependent receptor n=1 Tax=Sphingorhabdus arenilitoris TaxID=1490041 RepID=A0ABV8RDC5_9SPHN